jgi:hypothetical protein
MSRLINEITIKTKASKESVWKIWSDVPNWNKWDKEVEFSILDGEFMLGQTGILKPKKGPRTKIKVTEFTPFKSFSTTSNLPLAELRFDHYLSERQSWLYITHKISISGPLGFLFARLLGKNLAKGLEKSLQNLVKIAELYESKNI